MKPAVNPLRFWHKPKGNTNLLNLNIPYFSNNIYGYLPAPGRFKARGIRLLFEFFELGYRFRTELRVSFGLGSTLVFGLYGLGSTLGFGPSLILR